MQATESAQVRNTERNAQIWQALYAAGRNDLRYPSDMLVRLSARWWPAGEPRRILDYGCGTGANLAHLARLGHRVQGVEVAQSAVEVASSRLLEAGLSGQVHLVGAGATLPFEDESFDAVVAWQVLYYNERATWSAAIAEIERVAAPGARILIATAAPGDISHRMSQALGDSIYRSQVPGQEGCMLLIPERDELAALFPGRELEVGEFGHEFGGTRSRHWIITYRMPDA
ncbi:MAG TPA: class I SAM-dependent methyltransferase [Ramlibacter sp.]|uniref:class I SAM-dependent methyltransferase n=1 Tax=Ramlibacter sp. TaxID=1917967 RepID=UPI002C472D96|nr:class I SAM-dependent methyltransferase [Ramlibacter sp.]HVZ45353.1 class I SAM-dependent methyltransferase [Ramlibacter sp.]